MSASGAAAMSKLRSFEANDAESLPANLAAHVQNIRRVMIDRARVSSESGLALPLALLVLLLVSAVGFALIGVGMTEVTVATNWRTYNTAFYAADAGLQHGLVGLRDLFAQTAIPSSSQLNGITPPTLANVKVQSTLSVVNLCVSPCVPYRTTFTTGPYQGMYGWVTDYRITSKATGDGGTQATLTQTVRSTSIPLFQFGIFYGKGVGLELANTPPMTFNGRIHSNSNLHLGTKSTLTLDGKLTAAGKILRSLPSQSGFYYGNPQIKDANGAYKTLDFDHDYKPGGTTLWASPTDWANKALTTFGDTVKDTTMGVTELVPPIPELLKSPSNPDAVAHQLIELPQASDSAGLKAAKIYSQAGLRIVDGVATDMNGAFVSLPAGVLTTKSFYDARECRDVNVIEVDVKKLKDANLPALTTGNGKGILYVASTATPTGGMTTFDATACAAGGTMPAVRLVNGAELPTTGLTVASQNPVYVQGDYNSTNNYPNPATGVNTHPPAAIMGDAVTALSKNWSPNNSDTKGKLDNNKRVAVGTTLNAAVMTGPNKESVPGVWNGAATNAIRLLEDWDGVTFNYSGSLVSLWHSQQATADYRICAGAFAAGCYYDAPDRTWSYDTLFDAAGPPGAPGAIVISPGQWAQK